MSEPFVPRGGATDRVNEYLEQFDDNWVQAGPPSPTLTICLVMEIRQLRRRVAELERFLEAYPTPPEWDL
jgi:hypothetical protein